MDDKIDFNGLPDDPFRAFIEIVRHYDAVLRADTRGQLEDADTRLSQLNHMSSILAAARALDISQLKSWSLPDMDNVYSTHRDFDLAVKGLVLQFQITSARIGKAYSVSLDQPSRERIHNLVEEIRKAIDKSSLEEKKRNSLYAKLNSFIADVDRSRTRFDNAMSMILAVGTAASDLATEAGNALAPVNEMLARIERILGKAKSKEPEVEKLPAPDDVKQIEPPPKRITGFGRSPLSDDIPF